MNSQPHDLSHENRTWFCKNLNDALMSSYNRAYLWRLTCYRNLFLLLLLIIISCNCTLSIICSLWPFLKLIDSKLTYFDWPLFQILKVDAENAEYQLSCLRSLINYTWPEVEDVSWISHTQIVDVLGNPDISIRDQYSFAWTCSDSWH